MKALLVVASLLITGGVVGYLVAEKPSSAELTPGVVAHDAPRSGKPTAQRERAGEREPRRDGTLEDRVARLEDEVVTLRRQLALRGRVAVSGGSSEPASIVDDPVLDEQVRDIFEQEREREQERNQELRRERNEEMRIVALDELEKVAGLGEEQRSTIDGLWSTEVERLTPLMEAMRSGERSFSEVREEIRTVRKETDDAARTSLSDAQYEHYEELRPRGPGGGRGGGGGGGRGRP